MNGKSHYTLETRTTLFSKRILTLINSIKISIKNKNSINQLIRSSSSIGANYREANGASSKRDFLNKIYFCKKESKETEYWLELIAESNPEIIKNCRKLWRECHQLTLIFSKIISTARKKNKHN